MDKREILTALRQASTSLHRNQAVAGRAQLGILIGMLEKDLADEYTGPSPKLRARSEQIDLLEKYTRFLQKNGYIDTDATCEEPFAIEEFMKELDSQK